MPPLWTWVLGLLAASPAEPEPRHRLVIFALGDAAERRAAAEAATALPPDRFVARVANLGRWLETRGPTCAVELACLCQAPQLAGADWVIQLRASKPAPRWRTSDLRVLLCPEGRVLARSSEVVAEAGFGAHAGRAVQRLLYGAAPGANTLPRGQLLTPPPPTDRSLASPPSKLSDPDEQW